MNRTQMKWMALALLLSGCEAPMGNEAPGVEKVSAERQTLVVKQPAREQVSTRLTLRWRRDGQLEVVDAVELPGFLRLEKNLHNRRYVYEVRSDQGVLAVQGVDLDFTRHAAGANPEAGEHLPKDTETFFVDVPGLGLEQLTNASVRLLEAKSAHTETVASREAVGRLEQQGRLARVAEVRAAQVGSFIRAEGRRAPKQSLARPDDARAE